MVGEVEVDHHARVVPAQVRALDGVQQVAAAPVGGPPRGAVPQRPYCQPGLEQTYGMKFAGVQDLDIGTPTNQALQQGVVSIGLVLSTDPILAKG